MKVTPIDTEDYKTHLSNVTPQGKRIWIYPRIVKGLFYKLRTYVSWLLLGLLLGLPWVSIDGHPLFMFNILERRFIFFGVTFFPQDFHLVAIGLLSFMVFVILFTVIFGRIWCGWACPQTIFMEMLFRKIEILIEGDYNAQKRLDAQPWNTEKIFKKTAKHLTFIVLSFVIANVFLAYTIGKQALLKIVTDSPIQHIAGLSAILIFTGVFYFVFARFRELVCIMVCPYGRLQGVMLDKKSWVVAYDFIRGEPRGKHQTAEQKTEALYQNQPIHGACIDCKICVQVCPTGIDIRNGTQLECIGCTACIDACDEVMDKIHEPRGLVRYASIEGIEQHKKLTFNTRIAAYSLVLVALLSILGLLLWNRSPTETTIIKTPGLVYQTHENGTISNLYTVQVLNKTYQKMPVSFRLKKINGQIKMIGKTLVVNAGTVEETSFFIFLPKKSVVGSQKVEVEVVSNKKVLEVIPTKFLGPMD